MAATGDEWRAPGVPVPPSPVLAESLGGLDTALDGLAGLAVESLGDDDVARLLDQLTRVAARVAGLTAAVGEADHRRLGDAIGARHTGQWWARRSLLTRPEANRLTRLGRHLADELYAPVHAALAGGELHADQAAVIVNAVEAIPVVARGPALARRGAGRA